MQTHAAKRQELVNLDRGFKCRDLLNYFFSIFPMVKKISKKIVGYDILTKVFTYRLYKRGCHESLSYKFH